MPKIIAKPLTILILSISCMGVYGQKLITLDRALEIAGSNSPDIQRSRLNLERYRESLNAQRASLKSKFQLNLAPLEYENSRSFNSLISKWNTYESTQSSGSFSVSQPILPTDATISLINRFGWQKSFSEYNSTTTKSFSNNVYLNINQPLFTHNKTRLELQGIELDYENANLSYSMQLLNLEKGVSQYFYQVYLAQMSVSIARDELDKTRQSFEIIDNKVKAGLSAVEQLYQAELNLMNAQSTMQNREVELENLKDNFKLYIGMPFTEEMVTLANISVNPVEVDLSIAVQHALGARMELRQREIEIENSLQTLIRTKSMNEFKGDLTLSVGIIGDNESLPDIYDNPTTSPKVSLSFNVPIFDWGEKRSRVKAQEAVIKSSEINLVWERKQIEMNIRRVYRSLQNQLTQIEIAKQNEKNAQLTYEINLERYRNGDLTSMDLKLYQNQLSEKKMSLVQAQINYKLELLNLKIQALYDFEHSQPIVPSSLFGR